MKPPTLLAALILIGAICTAVDGQRLLDKSLQINLQLPGPPGPQHTAYPYGYDSSLIVTGNVRYGKAFHGTSAFGQIDSQFIGTLPSTGLDTFRRDSIGISDILNGPSYGQTVPFYSDSGQVTTPQTAGQRFAPKPIEEEPSRLPSAQPIQPLVPPTVEPEIPAEPYSPYTYESILSTPEWMRQPSLLPAEPAEKKFPQRPMPPADSDATKKPGELTPLPALPETPEGQRLEAEPQEALPPLPQIYRPADAERSFESYMRRGHQLFQKGKYAEAAEMYELARMIKQNDPAAYLAHGHALLASGHFHQAALTLQRAVIMYPDWVTSDQDLADVFADPKDLSKREEEIRDYLSRSPDVIAHNFLMGYILWHTGRGDEARPFFEKVVKKAEDPTKKAAELFLKAPTEEPAPSGKE